MHAGEVIFKGYGERERRRVQEQDQFPMGMNMAAMRSFRAQRSRSSTEISNADKLSSLPYYTVHLKTSNL